LSLCKRQENERKFSNFKELPDELRLYWFEIEGRTGWKTRYVKIVDRDEVTVSFRQEIYNEEMILVEIHEKYPIDSGHKKVEP
jgi:hypothetical protein